jgi:DNA-binding beta-propeller fold protein YncE
MDRHPTQRTGRRAIAILALGTVLLQGGTPAYACTGDCDGDGSISISELITGVSIVLGTRPVSDCAALQNAQGGVDIAQLVKAVGGALNGCSDFFTISGSCVAPGAARHGLQPCASGTAITVLRCDRRDGCLHAQQALTRVAATAVLDAGAWSARVPQADSGALFVFEAQITNAVVYRTVSIGSVGAAGRLGRTRGAAMPSIAITPATEAAVQLLDAQGLENCSDAGAQAVIGAVEDATASLSYDDVPPDRAPLLALQTASADATVMMVLATARNTPTATATSATPTVTPTPTPTPPLGLVFVAAGRSNRVEVIDPAARVVRTELTVGAGPTSMALTSDGGLLLVTNSGLAPATPTPSGSPPECPAQLCPDTVSIIDTASRTVRATIPDCDPGEDDPYGVAITPDGLAYVANNLSDSVSVVDVARVVGGDASCAAVTRLPLEQGAAPEGIVAARRQPLVYVANSGTGRLAVIQRASGNEVATFELPGTPSLLALTHDDARLYATMQTETGGAVAVIDTALLFTPGAVALRKLIPVGGSPTGIAISADDATVYVANTARGAEALQVISRTGDPPDRVVSTVHLHSGAQPIAVALSGDARTAYVTNCAENSVTFIDTAKAIADPPNAVAYTLSLGAVPKCPQGIVALEP